jgi:hypothetical protein
MTMNDEANLDELRAQWKNTVDIDARIAAGERYDIAQTKQLYKEMRARHATNTDWIDFLMSGEHNRRDPQGFFRHVLPFLPANPVQIKPLTKKEKRMLNGYRAKCNDHEWLHRRC